MLFKHIFTYYLMIKLIQSLNLKEYDEKLRKRLEQLQSEKATETSWDYNLVSNLII